MKRNKRDENVRMLLSSINFRTTRLKIAGDITLVSSDLTVNLEYLSTRVGLDFGFSVVTSLEHT